ncbi:MAG: nucleotide exchange factor GrpE [Candidatus Gracilibacteria bacterium]|nr:nucleotide exchange factor GrpE [Candidatus Gracilibacteria bacterium]
MTSEEKNKIEEQDIVNEMEQELENIVESTGEDSENDIGENFNDNNTEDIIIENESDINIESQSDSKCKEMLARTMADYENFKKRVERDKMDMIFFLKSDIFKKILPRLDDLERILKNTPDDMKIGVLYEGLVSLESKFQKDIENLGIKSFVSIGSTVDPDKHDVMTTVPGQLEGIIFDEFEKGYMLGDRVLRHAKVVVGAGN